MSTAILEEMYSVFKPIRELWTEDVLDRSLVASRLKEYDVVLLDAISNSKLLQSTFMTTVNDMVVFKLDHFIDVLRFNTYLDSSYTTYSTYIGLNTDGKYLNYSSDVVLDFPYKDAVLRAGMTREDLKKKTEAFYHKILAKYELDILLTPKVLFNSKRINQEGVSDAIDFDDSDNLLIKGNNLIALSTLKARYEKSIKLIYIDPPYNTGGDSFNYNDRFNHSTWLTFMKNRLEIARDLLSSDGSIWINIDDDESHYLKVLCDEIFGRDNFIGNIIWQKKYSPQNDAKYFSDMHDHILVYAKNKEIWRPNPMPRTAEMNSRYTNRDNDERGPWKAADFTVKTYSAEYDYEIETPGGKIVRPSNGRSWGTSKDNFEKLVADNRIWFGKDGNNVPAVKKFLSEVKDGVSPITTWTGENLYENEEIDMFWHYSDVSHTQDAKKELINLALDFSTPKPEKLLERIITIGSNPNDLVLDFFLGSGTTAAVAMKMNRKFIGVEQMEYVEDLIVNRLKKVIDGDQGGISKSVGWSGGGSFIYTELYPLNENYISMIQSIENDETFWEIFDSIKNSAYLDFQVDLDKIVPSSEQLISLSLEDKKNILINLLDANQLYLSYSEIEDAQFEVSFTTKQFNRSFYKDDMEDVL